MVRRGRRPRDIIKAMITYDLIIIGGGPAGLSAAIYARRANLSVLLIEESGDGGKLSKISKIDNYPGIESISGFELAMNLVNHAKSYGTQIVNDKVIKIENKAVKCASGEIYEGKTILIATGSKQRKLDIPNASEYDGKGISYCATCDGFFFKNKEVVVIGNNNQAFEESLYLTNLVSKLTIINRYDNLDGDETLLQAIASNEKIEIINNVIPEELIIEDSKIVGIQIKDINTNKTSNINCAGIFPYISFNPGTDFVDKELIDDKGYIVTNQDMSTKMDGIFAAGDCIQKNLRQVVTACSDGAIAATSIIKYVKKWFRRPKSFLII